MEIEKKAKSIVDDAFSDIIQELIIIDGEKKHRVVFIHSVEMTDEGLKVEFSTPEGDKDALIPLVHEAIKAQLDTDVSVVVRTSRRTKKSLWRKIIDFIGGIHF